MSEKERSLYSIDSKTDFANYSDEELRLQVKKIRENMGGVAATLANLYEKESSGAELTDDEKAQLMIYETDIFISRENIGQLKNEIKDREKREFNGEY